MNQLLDDLIKVMTLERLEINLFRGESRDIGSPQVFGGQVLGQALVAATATVGGSASCTRCTPIFCAAGISIRRSSTRSTARGTASISPPGASSPFSTASRSSICPPRSKLPEAGLDHQFPMPDVPLPEILPDLESHYSRMRCKDCRRHAPTCWSRSVPSSFSPVEPPDPSRAGKIRPPLKYVWFRAVDKLPDEEALHRCLLAYVSDFHLLDTALKPHGISLVSPTSW